jgi:hypothetical protein
MTCSVVMNTQAAEPLARGYCREVAAEFAEWVRLFRVFAAR